MRTELTITEANMHIEQGAAEVNRLQLEVERLVGELSSAMDTVAREQSKAIEATLHVQDKLSEQAKLLAQNVEEVKLQDKESAMLNQQQAVEACELRCREEWSAKLSKAEKGVATVEAARSTAEEKLKQEISDLEDELLALKVSALGDPEVHSRSISCVQTL